MQLLTLLVAVSAVLPAQALASPLVVVARDLGTSPPYHPPNVLERAGRWLKTKGLRAKHALEHPFSKAVDINTKANNLLPDFARLEWQPFEDVWPDQFSERCLSESCLLQFKSVGRVHSLDPLNFWDRARLGCNYGLHRGRSYFKSVMHLLTLFVAVSALLPAQALASPLVVVARDQGTAPPPNVLERAGRWLKTKGLQAQHSLGPSLAVANHVGQEVGSNIVTFIPDFADLLAHLFDEIGPNQFAGQCVALHCTTRRAPTFSKDSCAVASHNALLTAWTAPGAPLPAPPVPAVPPGLQRTWWNRLHPRASQSKQVRGRPLARHRNRHHHGHRPSAVPSANVVAAFKPRYWSMLPLGVTNVEPHQWSGVCYFPYCVPLDQTYNEAQAVAYLEAHFGRFEAKLTFVVSHQALFSVMLREWGVQGIQVNEMLGLDDTFLEMLPQPVYGLIFLYRWQEKPESSPAVGELPPGLWFANQTSPGSCASVALLNIVNNLQGIERGENLKSFRDFTADFTPPLRGVAIDNFEFVKRIHNRFARKMDMLATDLTLKTSAASRAREEALRTRREAVAAKRKNENKVTKKTKKKGGDETKATVASTPGKRTFAAATTDHQEGGSGQDETHHFIAFVEAGGHAWAMDGYNTWPADLGAVARGTSWLEVVRPSIKARIEEEGHLSFSLLALVHDPLPAAQVKLAQNIKLLRLVEGKMAQQTPDWKAHPNSLLLKTAPDAPTNVPGPNRDRDRDQELACQLDPSIGVTEAMIHSADLNMPPLTDSEWHASERLGLDTDLDELLQIHGNLVSSQSALRAVVRVLVDGHKVDEVRVANRRFDFRPFIHAWLEATYMNGLLREYLGEHDARKSTEKKPPENKSSPIGK
ncbi:MAG: hypothetical protein M1826_000733 [Phylliscum demangeonii]|nr:MAG: hypothetical protein M1826_000733 [Phylliscum demangeonii]